jgi:hypothetical protein
MRTIPSRLQRTLDPLVGYGTNIIGISASNVDTFNHTDIQQISITRGANSKTSGYLPATVEATVTGRYDGFAAGSPFHVWLRDVHVDRLADLVGVTADSISTRYTGRLGAVSVEDRARRVSTKLTAVSWMAQLAHSPRHVAPAAGELLTDVLERLTFQDDPVRGTDLITRVDGAQLQHHAAGDPQLYPQALTGLAADIGIVMQEQRDGTTVAWGHKHREWWAANRMATQWPLMRHQALAPARYEQMGERPATPIDYTAYITDGSLRTRSVEPPNPTGETVMRETRDWTRWRMGDLDNQLWRSAWSDAHSRAVSVYRLPELSIDLLMLLRMGTEYSLKIAGQLLTLEAGEPIYLSGDWPPRLRGVHYAEGITETITPSEWRFDLSLIPHALGAGTPTPTVPPLAWDSFITAWDAETRTWDA